MTEAKLQPSPWGSGPFGWLGTALILLGACFWVATLLLFVWAGFQQDLRFVFLGILSFLGIFPLIAAGFFVPRAGSRRAASFQPRLATTGPKGVISAITLMILGWVLGIGGFLYVMYFTTTRFDLGFQIGLFAFTAAVLGGIGNLAGAALGGLLIGLIQNFNEGLAWHSPGPKWTESIVFAILILILVFRPQGLLGERTPEGG